MNWLREVAIRFWKGTGRIQSAGTSPSYKAPGLPPSLVISLPDENSDDDCNKRCTCFTCKTPLPLANIFESAICFYYYPGERFANGERIPLLMLDCPWCKERLYLAIFSNSVEIGMFGASPVMDPIPTAIVNASVQYELHQDYAKDAGTMTNCVCVSLDENYYARIYEKI